MTTAPGKRTHKLSADEVRAIFTDTRPYAQIAAAFGISRVTLIKIKRQRSHRSLTADLDQEFRQIRNLSIKQVLARFRTFDPVTGCWLWTRGTTAGYGYFRIDSEAFYAHRAAYELRNGPIPLGLHVLHRCDTPLCINPDHLFLGCQRDNNLDSTAKGRRSRGEQHCHAKLTTAQVIDIRRDPRSQTDVANDYGVSPSHIWRIRNLKAWRHV